jgi:hypothetical protein
VILGLRTKIDSIVRRGGIPDEDCPTDAASTKFWCTTQTKYTDRESCAVKMTARAAVAPTPDALGSLLPTNLGGGSLALGVCGDGATESVTPTGPSLEALVDVIRGGGAGNTTAPKAKPKAKGKRVQRKSNWRKQRPHLKCAMPCVTLNPWHFFGGFRLLKIYGNPFWTVSISSTLRFDM